MNSEPLQREGHRLHHLVLPPDANAHASLLRVGDEMYLDVFVEGHVRYPDIMIEQGNAPIDVGHSRLPQAEDVLE